MTALILALDASSTVIGWVLYDGILHDHGEICLPKADIAERCHAAEQELSALLLCYPAIDCLAIESPVARYGAAVIAQARVSGALLCAATQQAIPVVEVTPQAAKKALTGKGNADKAAMQERAAGYGVCGEHAADALGVALAAVKVVKVERQVA